MSVLAANHWRINAWSWSICHQEWKDYELHCSYSLVGRIVIFICDALGKEIVVSYGNPMWFWNWRLDLQPNFLNFLLSFPIKTVIDGLFTAVSFVSNQLSDSERSRFCHVPTKGRIKTIGLKNREQISLKGVRLCDDPGSGLALICTLFMIITYFTPTLNGCGRQLKYSLTIGIARWNRPLVFTLIICAATLVSPNSVIWFGSPLNALMWRWIHCRALRWSHRPKLPVPGNETLTLQQADIDGGCQQQLYWQSELKNALPQALV